VGNCNKQDVESTDKEEHNHPQLDYTKFNSNWFASVNLYINTKRDGISATPN
jgi:hypothetical protein